MAKMMIKILTLVEWKGEEHREKLKIYKLLMF